MPKWRMSEECQHTTSLRPVRKAEFSVISHMYHWKGSVHPLTNSKVINIFMYGVAMIIFVPYMYVVVDSVT